MRPGEVEQWVLRVIDQLERGLRVEDDRVECKRHLPDDPAKAARRIAGHANQVRDDRILWIVGVDETPDRPILGKGPTEPDAAVWWPQVEARFHEVAPSPTWVNVPAGDGLAVLGLGFETSRPPYVVRVPGENPSREVPWREGTRVRSAGRSDLLKLLVPLADRPRVSVLGGRLGVSEVEWGSRPVSGRQRGGPRLHWSGVADLYVDCSAPLVFPDHRCDGRVILASGYEVELDVTPGAPQRRLPGRAASPLALQAEQGDKQVVLHNSAPILLRLVSATGPAEASLSTSGRLEVEMLTGGLDPATVKLVCELAALPADQVVQDEVAQWSIQPA